MSLICLEYQTLAVVGPRGRAGSREEWGGGAGKPKQADIFCPLREQSRSCGEGTAGRQSGGSP